MKEVVVDHIISGFDEHIVEFVCRIGVGVGFDLFDLDQFVGEVRGVVVPVGMP